MKTRLRPYLCLLFFQLFSTYATSAYAMAETFYVSTQGQDAAGRGSLQQPWASISFALDQINGGSTIEVLPGTYSGRVRLDRHFSNPVTIKSSSAYLARLRHSGETVVTCYSCSGITLEGFDIAHSPNNNAALVIQIQSSDTDNVTLRNNIIHDSTNNDLLKVNNGARNVLIEGNLFYNQAGSDEHIDVNSTEDVTIQDNVFFNTSPQSATSSFIVVKDSNGNSDGVLGTKNTTIRRNVFLNWQGSSGQGFLRVGEDDTSNFEADGVLIENNLLLGNSPTLMRSALTIQGARDVRIRNNTVVGDLPARNFAIRLLRGNQNQANTQITVSNNIWSDPTGTMGTEGFIGADVFEALSGSTGTVSLNRNLYFNGGSPIPLDAEQEVRASQDPAAIFSDPMLPNPQNVISPTWSGTQFAGGESTIRAVFLNLVEHYGKPNAASTVIDTADPSDSAADDIRGLTRDSAPDIGAFEHDASAVPPNPPSDGKPILSWLMLLLDQQDD